MQSQSEEIVLKAIKQALTCAAFISELLGNAGSHHVNTNYKNLDPHDTRRFLTQQAHCVKEVSLENEKQLPANIPEMRKSN